jgi:hypothetical protein
VLGSLARPVARARAPLAPEPRFAIEVSTEASGDDAPVHAGFVDRSALGPVARTAVARAAAAPTSPTHLARARAPSDTAGPPASPLESGPLRFTTGGAEGLSSANLGLDPGRPIGRDVLNGATLPAPAGEAPDNVAPGIETSLLEALDARDRELGIDMQGTLVSTAEDVVRSADPGLLGRAVLEIDVDPSGDVTGVRLVDATALRSTWEGVASRIGEALRAHPGAPRKHAQRVRLAVTAESRMPSGARPDRPIEPYVKLGSHGAGPARPDPAVGVGAHFDVSDIGARPLRAVHARVVGTPHDARY